MLATSPFDEPTWVPASFQPTSKEPPVIVLRCRVRLPDGRVLEYGELRNGDACRYQTAAVLGCLALRRTMRPVVVRADLYTAA